MQRPVGVTASAVVAIIGSVFTLLMAVVMLATAFIETPQSQTPGYTQIAVGSALVFAALAGLGVWTAIGLLRLRPWARTSILVFAGFAAALCLFMLIVTSVMPMPMPPQADPAVARTMRPTLIATFGIPFAIAVWWLIQFNTRATSAAFSGGMPVTEPRRPLSISIIAWTSIIGGASCLVPILLRMPAFIAGIILTGWAGGVTYAFFGALSLYIGWGLLDLRERARVLAIAWFAFGLVHTAVVTLIPSLRQRMLQAQSAFTQNQPQPPPFDQAILTNITLVCVAVIAVAAIFFLVRNRPAFRSS
jgi:hypothetical protein